MPRRFQNMMPFHPAYDFQAFRAFTFDGHDLKGGDPFPPEGSDRPADTVLEKLYRQKFITFVAPAADVVVERFEPLKPVPINVKAKVGKAERKAKAREAMAAVEAAKAQAAAEEAEKVAAAKAAESAQGDAPEQPADAPTEDKPDAETVEQKPAADASQPAGADNGPGNAGAPADAANAGLKPFHAGFGKWQVLDADGKVLAEDLTKAEAHERAGVELPTKK